ncbi:MAG: TonB-dependent receptor [Gammaproteobacteria bacterium]
MPDKAYQFRFACPSPMYAWHPLYYHMLRRLSANQGDTNVPGKYHQRSVLFAAAAALTASAIGAQAQQTGTLEEVLVTAQKREQNIQDVPLSVTTLSGENLDVITSAGADIRSLSARIPSLLIESSFGRTFPRFYIRGLGNTDFDGNASQPVSLVYDDVVLENPFVKGFPMFDIDRVEVLRGPQGTLFGRNSPAGIIKIDSRKPTQELDGYISGSVGSFEQVDIEGAIGGPITDTLSARASVLIQSRDDYVENIGPAEDTEGYDEFAARVQLLWQPSDQFNALFNVHSRDLDGTARVFRANIIREGSNDFSDDYDRERVQTNGLNDQELESLGGVAKLTYDFANGMSVTSITAYEDVYLPISVGDIDGGTGDGPGFIPFQSVTGSETDVEQFTQELRLSGDTSSGLFWQTGVFFFEEELAIRQRALDETGLSTGGLALQQQETSDFGVFGHLSYEFSDQWAASGGVRFSDTEKEFVASRPFSFIGPLAPQTVNPDDSEVSWDLSLTFSASDDVSFYSRVARGFRAPSVQGRTLFGNDITIADSETNTSIEVGMKSQLLDNRLRLNGAIFSYVLDDQQLTAVGGAANTASLINADTTNGYGFELDAELAVNDNLYLTAGLSYNNTEIDDPNISVPVCGSPCNPTDPLNADGRAIIDGNSLPQAPEWIANFTARYSQPWGDHGEFFALTDWAYRSEVNFFLYESVSFNDDDLLEGGLRVGYASNDGKWDVALFGRNITDDESLTGGIDFNNLTGFVNEPRVWGIQASMRFD